MEYTRIIEKSYQMSSKLHLHQTVVRLNSHFESISARAVGDIRSTPEVQDKAGSAWRFSKAGMIFEPLSRD
jgi:hypothetical protein